MIFVVRMEGFSDKLYFHVDIDGEKKTVLRSLPSPLALPETRGRPCRTTGTPRAVLVLVWQAVF